MAKTTTPQQIRYNTIDRCLCDKNHRYTIKDLKEQCEKALKDADELVACSERTIQGDIERMQHIYDVSIVKYHVDDRRVNYYRYKDPNFSIRKGEIAEGQLGQLVEALKMLRRIKGMPQFDELDTLYEKLQTHLNINIEESSVIGFDDNPDYKGLEHFSTLYNHIVARMPVRIVYKDFKHDEQFEVVFHPYYLKEYNRRWFLFGWQEARNCLSTFALDRIEEIHEVEVEFKAQPEDLDFEEYFDERIGVSSGTGNIVRIELWASKHRWPYIATKPIHPTMKNIVEVENGVTFTIDVVPTRELCQLILSYGSDLRIIAPQEALIDKMRQITQEMYAFYR